VIHALCVDPKKRREPDQSMNRPIRRIAIILAMGIAGLLAMDLIGRSHPAVNVTLPEFGVAADSAAAVFLVGLISGLLLGIGLFFGYLMLRERQENLEPDGMALLFEELNHLGTDDFEDLDDYFADEDAVEEHADSIDPWERPADWWKGEDDD
jgi:hypothetical protein